ncbi:MAG: hypothetical protein WCK77_23250 [Verrucomicrobiota bacterium]
MKHILDPNEAGIHFGRYLEALAGYRHRLSPHVAQFAGDADRFTLNHPKSLHDAWLQSVVVTETRRTAAAPSAVKVELLLLGQHHDRVIRISYERVSRYGLHGQPGERCAADAFHGDVLTHEVRVADTGHTVHEIAFVTGSVFTVECEDFIVADEPILESDGEPPAPAPC